jgi:hypothetical protein
MKVKAAFNNIVPQTCGVGILGVFREEGKEYGNYGGEDVHTIHHKGGCDWLIAGFTAKLPAYKKAYYALIERYGEPVYQSPKRLNKRTNKIFFFAIWDTKDKQ